MTQAATRTVPFRPAIPDLPELPRVTVIDRKRVLHHARWARSLFGFRDLLRVDEPWVTFHAIDWLERVVEPGWRVAEFGSGASTLYWSRRVSHITAVEHHRGWHTKLTRAFEVEGVRNCRYVLAEPRRLSRAERIEARSQKKGFEELCFRDYANALADEPAGTYDLIFVDGRARVACAEAAVHKVRSGGWLVLDNAERPRYAELRKRFAGYRRLDFTSMGPRQIGRWTTSAWHVR
ncbi:MAG: class I SAM-dependent methyltransferase [Planctomycetota bacterium]